MTPRTFGITWDYRCPFARNAHEHVLTALAAGAPWDVAFLPFSLGQAHVGEGEPDVWDEPDRDSGLLALQVGVTVRDQWPDRFHAVHRGLFDLRHRDAGDLRDRDALARVLAANDVDDQAVFGEIDDGWPLKTIRDEHTGTVASHGVWGVPTFLVGTQAVFVRLMHRPEGDAEVATRTIERVLDLIEWPELNEFKHTRIPR